MKSWYLHYYGIPYIEGGRNPAEGLDCFGLVQYIYYRELGIELSESDMSMQDKFVIVKDRKEFDIAFFEHNPGHVGIVLANTEYMVHTTPTGAVCISRIYGHPTLYRWKPSQ